MTIQRHKNPNPRSAYQDWNRSQRSGQCPQKDKGTWNSSLCEGMNILNHIDILHQRGFENPQGSSFIEKIPLSK